MLLILILTGFVSTDAFSDTCITWLFCIPAMYYGIDNIQPLKNASLCHSVVYIQGKHLCVLYLTLLKIIWETFRNTGKNKMLIKRFFSFMKCDKDKYTWDAINKCLHAVESEDVSTVLLKALLQESFLAHFT